jgi:hypothetical protein
VTPQGIGTIGLYVSAVIATVGFAVFAVTARFWASRGGWHVFWYMLVIAWILDLTTVAHFVHGHAWFMWLRVLSFAIGLPIVLAWRSWIIFDLQLRQRWMAYGVRRQRPATKEERHDGT